jgi:hypothetical protein
VSGNGVALTAINASNVTSGTLDNARTTGNTANSASTLVLRDADGSFGANIVTATFSGNGATLSAINASNISSGTIANARTTAASANGASTIVQRDAGGNFAAATITAAVIGDLSGGSNINASNIASGTIANARTTASSSNGASTIVLRGASGEFAAGAITGTSFSGNGSAITAINATAITTGTLDNARTNATSANGASTLVLRDANGSFAGNVITGTTGTFTNISGNGVSLTAINASNISSGTLSATRGGTGSANLTANNVILGNGAGTVQVVAPGTANNVLTSNGTTWISQAGGGGGGTTIPAGTVMIFGQTAAPTGFTKLTDQDNAGLRVVSGTASTGGSVNFTTAFASQTPTGSVSITAVSGSAGATTLTTPQIPSHSHTFLPAFQTNVTPRNAANGSAPGNPQVPASTSSTGGDGSHTHPFSFSSGSGTFSGNAINLAVKYVDVIRATKD